VGGSQRWLHPHDEQHIEGDPPVQVPVLHGDGHQQPADEEHVGVLQVLDAHLEEGRGEEK